MTRKEFVKTVVAEIENIKLKATVEERGKLNKESFNHVNIDTCIYGQMTGLCNSNRANELSAKVYEEYTKDDDTGYTNLGKTFTSHSLESGKTATALEKYLYMATKEQQYNIIEYIKDETQTLNIK